MEIQKIKILFIKEIKSYFNTPIGYVFLFTGLSFNFLFFFIGLGGLIPEFWEAKVATVRPYMNLLPISFILLVPAVSMRIWAEEKKTGSIEFFQTLPLRDIEMVLGKFLAAWAFVSALILAAIPLTISIWLIGPLDWGTTITIYFGSLLMAGAYVSTGMVISALTREQIVAFILTFFISLFMFIGNYYIVSHHLPVKLARLMGFFSHSYHFSSFARGALDSGDIIYYISFICAMLIINIWVLRKDR